MNQIHPRDRDIAMVFQNYALYPQMNVFDNIAFSLQIRKTYPVYRLHVANIKSRKRSHPGCDVYFAN